MEKEPRAERLEQIRQRVIEIHAQAAMLNKELQVLFGESYQLRCEESREPHDIHT